MNDRRVRRLSAAGFTIPEVVISMAILAGGLAVLMTTFTMAAKAIYSARNEFLAMNYAREQIEMRRLLVYRHPLLNVGTYTTNAGLYDATLVISNLRTNEKQVEVRVLYTNYVTRSMSTASYFTIMSDAIH
jgi:prepilin-type N-terminal cleavage/methylation domain-containing protein